MNWWTTRGRRGRQGQGLGKSLKQPVEPVRRPVLLRTDFDRPQAWQDLCAILTGPQARGLGIDPIVVDSLLWENAIRWGSGGPDLPVEFVLVADRTTLTRARLPLLVREVGDRTGPRRVPARSLAAIAGLIERPSDRGEHDLAL